MTDRVLAQVYCVVWSTIVRFLDEWLNCYYMHFVSSIDVGTMPIVQSLCGISLLCVHLFQLSIYAKPNICTEEK